MKINFKSLITFLFITLGTGGLSALVTMGSMDEYSALNKPFLAPPPVVFPIVWTVLFILMGLGAYLVYESDCENRSRALIAFFMQLVVNFIWPILFFRIEAFLLSFVWLVLLWILILYMIIQFYRCKPLSAYLQIPYILWVTFAGYLNLSIYILNSVPK